MQQKAYVMESLFESATRTAGDLSVVFECDGDGGYFYLFDLTKAKGQQARAVIAVSERGIAFDGSEVSVGWNESEDIAGLRIRGELCAAFDQTGRCYGGSYGMETAPAISVEVSSRFYSNCVRVHSGGPELNTQSR
jgi:hypothetical protein